MSRDEIQARLSRDPFVPFRLHVKPGKVFDVAFADVARVLSHQMLVFVGLKEGTRRAESFDSFPFDHIERIEDLPARGSGRRRKAS